MRTIGIDPSMTATGVAIINTGPPLVVETHTVTSKGAATATLAHRWGRLATLAHEVRALAAGADLVVIEAPAYDSRTGQQHDRSGLWWAIVSQLIGVTDVVEVTTGGLKKYATGTGNAAKDTVLLAVARRYPEVAITDNNQSDALILAAMGARWAGHPIDDLPASHLTPMAHVAWPQAAPGGAS